MKSLKRKKRKKESVNYFDQGNYVVEKEQGIEARTKEGGVRLFVRNGARSTTRPPALHSLVFIFSLFPPLFFLLLFFLSRSFLQVLSGNMEDQIKYCQKMKDHTQQKLYKITEEVKGKEKEVQNARNLLRQTEVKLNKLGAAANIIDRFFISFFLDVSFFFLFVFSKIDSLFLLPPILKQLKIEIFERQKTNLRIL